MNTQAEVTETVRRIETGDVARMTIRPTFVVKGVRAFDCDHAKKEAKKFAEPYLFGWNLQAEAKRERDGTYTVTFR